MSKLKLNGKLLEVSFEGEQYFTPSQVSMFCGYPSNRVNNFIRDGSIKKGKHYIVLDAVDRLKLKRENENEGKVHSVKYLLTPNGFRAIYDNYNRSYNEFPENVKCDPNAEKEVKSWKGGLKTDEVIEREEKESVHIKPTEDLSTKEFRGLRVVTLRDVDEVHGRIKGTAGKRFQDHRERFIEGEDYFFVNGEQNTEIRGFEIPPRGLILLTESGYLMLVKSFTDDLSWKVQRQLINGYFKARQYTSTREHSYMIEDPITRAERWIEEQKEKLMLEQRVAEFAPKVTYYDKILQSTDCLTVTQIAKDYGLTAQGLNKILHKEGVQYKLGGQWLLYRNHANQGYTKSETHSFVKKDGSTGTNLQTKWTQKGRLFIHNILTELGYDPDDLEG